MKELMVQVKMPAGKYCNGCPFFNEVVTSWGMEESAHECTFLTKRYEEKSLFDHKHKKIKGCPSL